MANKAWPKIPAYCVEWRSASMTAPAFWYYRDRDAAMRASKRMENYLTRTKVRKVMVPHGCPFMADIKD